MKASINNNMKKALVAGFLFVTVDVSFAQQDSTGLPGDHFSLEGALTLFKEANNIEAFEEALNKESNHVNNLDLNGDGEIDYLRVEDKMEGDAHALIIQALISETETQDVAVIEIEKTGEEEADLQIVGDTELYGEEVYAEPFDEKGSGGKGGPALYTSSVRVIVNVWFWPSVRFIYTPGYVAWISPWGWRRYPKWWKPWRPFAWHVHVTHIHRYHVHCHRVHTHRMHNAHRVYTPHRRTSQVVQTRHRAAHQAHRERSAANAQKKSRAINHNTTRSDRGNKAKNSEVKTSQRSAQGKSGGKKANVGKQAGNKVKGGKGPR
jgi:hypothetical protein